MKLVALLCICTVRSRQLTYVMHSMGIFLAVLAKVDSFILVCV